LLNSVKPVTNPEMKRIFNYELFRKYKTADMETIKKLFGVTFIVILFVGVSGFDKTQKIVKNDPNPHWYAGDTVPEKIKTETDHMIAEIHKAIRESRAALQNIDWNSMQAEIHSALKEINFDKLFEGLAGAIKEIDTKEMAEHLKKEVNSIDLDKMKTEMNKALDAIDHLDLKMNRDQKESLKRNLEKIKPEMEKKMQELKSELEQMKKQMKRTANEHYTNIQDQQFYFSGGLMPYSI
jgi:paraquat-inducible protein B